jgi:hypothetical protein
MLLLTRCTVDRADQTNWRNYYVMIPGNVAGYASLTHHTQLVWS